MTPLEIKAALDAAIADAVAARDNHAISKKDFTRSRKLPADVMIKLLISMEGGSLNKELHRAGIDVSAASFVERRKQLCWWDFENVLNGFNQRCAGCDNVRTYKGYHIFAVDGTTVNMPLNPKSESYMENKQDIRLSYNAIHATPIYDVYGKIYRTCCMQPQSKQDEIGALLFMLAWYDFPPRTLIVGDRGFESQNLFCHFLEESNVDFLIRVKQNKGALREIAKLPMQELDTEISYTITTTQTNFDKGNDFVFIQTRKNKNRAYSNNTKASRWDFPSPYVMKFRVVRLMLPTAQYVTFVTSLPSSFTIEDIKHLYWLRWQVELGFKEIKYSLGLVNLHGKSDEFVRQEILAAMIMGNFCSRIINEVVIQQAAQQLYSVNRKMAIHLCRQFLRAEDGDEKQLLKEIAKYTEPIRPGRSDERNLKTKSFAGFVYRVSA